MDVDQILNNWRAQNPEALRQTLERDAAKVQQELRTRRRGLGFCGIVGTGMAIWAGFWIAITITNGWSAVYAVASGLSLALFTFAAGASWLARGRKPERNFGHTLEDAVKRSLTLVEDQLSITQQSILDVLGTVVLVVGALLFSWTLNRSQEIPESSGGGWVLFLLPVWIVWVFRGVRKRMQQAKPQLELRQQRLRELHMELVRDA